MKHILCHIVGMNNFVKNEFIDAIKKYDCISVIDLDILTNQIRENKKLINLYDELEKVNDKYKIIKKINEYWKTSMQEKYKAELDNIENNYIIIIGLCTYHKNNRLKININTENKFFVRMALKEYTKNIIEYNLKTYQNLIIDGTFPLEYLNPQFLIDEREKLLGIYKNLNYKQKSMDMIYKSIEKTKDVYDVCKYIYVASKNKYMTKIGQTKKYRNNVKLDDILTNNISNRTTDAYTDKWLAMLYLIENQEVNFKKGYDNNKPFVMEKKLDVLHTLNECAYVYKVPIELFKKKSNYKYTSKKKNIPIIEREFIPNILKYYRENITVYKFRLE